MKSYRVEAGHGWVQPRMLNQWLEPVVYYNADDWAPYNLITWR